MPEPCALFKFIGKALGNAIGGGLAGDFLVEVLPEVSQKVWGWWAQNRNDAARRAEVQVVANMTTEELLPQVTDILLTELPDQSPETKRVVESYLKLVPGAMRRSLRRPTDPTGRTAPPHLTFGKPEDLLVFLPARLPRFKPGDRMPGVDLELVELLGVGGFGEVWKARNPLLDGLPPVALKFCLDPKAKDRLLKHEAVILSQVMRHGRHEGIVQLLHTSLGADPPFLAYEYVEGGDLAGFIREMHQSGHRPAASEVAGVILRLAEIVGFAHRLHPPIVHRDLKPANILVQRPGDGEPHFKIADFGIGGVAASQAIQEATRGIVPDLYRASVACGSFTPLYASPQQMAGAPPDPRDDVFALGVIWHQLLTGDLNKGMPGGPMWRRNLLNQGMPEPMVELLESCFDEPEYRPANAAELAERLRAIVNTAAPALLATPAQPAQTVLSVVTKEPASEPSASAETASNTATEKKTGTRKERTLQVLQRHGLLDVGTEIELMPDVMPSDSVKSDERISKAKIGVLGVRKSVIWLFDSETYSLTDLSVKLEQHGLSWVRPKTYELWRIAGQSESMWELAEKLRGLDPPVPGTDKRDDGPCGHDPHDGNPRSKSPVFLPESDAQYLQWLESHRAGFVVNTQRRLSANQMVLHRARCKMIAEARPDAEPGGFVERHLIKVCADDVESLRDWVAANGRPDRTFSGECASCKPTT
jgi:serine/threonine protein kinase